MKVIKLFPEQCELLRDYLTTMSYEQAVELGLVVEGSEYFYDAMDCDLREHCPWCEWEPLKGCGKDPYMFP